MDALTRNLARAGIVCVLIPFIAPVLLGLVRLLQSGHLLVDYLMPYELFPLELLGAGLLTWSSLRARRRRTLIAGSIGASLALVITAAALATASGLSSGEQPAEGWRLALVVSCVAGSLLALLALAGAGVVLLRDLSHDLARDQNHRSGGPGRGWSAVQTGTERDRAKSS